MPTPDTSGYGVNVGSNAASYPPVKTFSQPSLVNNQTNPNIDRTFYGRDISYEIGKTIAAYDANKEEFQSVDTSLATYMSTRAITYANSAYAYYTSKVTNLDSNQQYVLGLSAASGGGQNTTYLADSISVENRLEMAKLAMENSNAIPIVVPFESPMGQNINAANVEALNAANIRAQQVRQAQASAGYMTASFPSGLPTTGATTWTGWDGASIVIGARGQIGAATTE